MAITDQLITRVSIPPVATKWQYKDVILMNGSCFSEHISDKLSRYKYNVLSNPFGILYNPESLAVSFERIAALDYYQPDELVPWNGFIHSPDHHGSFSGRDQNAVLTRINDHLRAGHEQLKRCTIVGISLGTSKVYRSKDSGAIVANCHKIPANAFLKEQLSPEDCTGALDRIHHAIHSLSPEARILWTVSPVRHISDGLQENQISKATLLLALSTWLRKHDQSMYFPAYEIMVDELRDYRYYNRDLIHPSPVAVDIIWERFAEAFIDPEQWKHHAAIEKIRRAMEHRMLHDDPTGMRTFSQNQLKQIEQLETLLPELHWENERRYFMELMESDSSMQE